MINGNSTLIQVFQLYQNKIKEKEHRNWRFNAAKYHDIAIANKQLRKTVLMQANQISEMDSVSSNYTTMYVGLVK